MRMGFQLCRLKMPCPTFRVEVSGRLPKGVGVRRHTRLRKHADFPHCKYHMKNSALIQKCGTLLRKVPYLFTGL